MSQVEQGMRRDDCPGNSSFDFKYKCNPGAAQVEQGYRPISKFNIDKRKMTILNILFGIYQCCPLFPKIKHRLNNK